MTSRLRRMREPLYEEKEAQAIGNTENLASKLLLEVAMGPQDTAQSQLAKARPWARQLWEELVDRPQSRWGYPVFLEPGYEQMEEYISRRDAVLTQAREAAYCEETLGARWKLQTLDWPIAAKDNNWTLEYKFSVMREVFQSITENTPKKQRLSHETEARSGGLDDGILPNVFLVIDRESIDTVMAVTGNVEDMWVWAVDVDFDTRFQPAEVATEQIPEEYRGYMRVSLQQLVNNFFEQRYLYAEDKPLACLWAAAAQSKNRAFVSLDELKPGFRWRHILP
ncbi:hypothetical protein GGS24DRAFT_190366 [Hypoxylon argillaceum]|nr:hypothetical protein GGS24DRAFT_190366 [Hypoxylon argillaceum]